MPDSPAMRRATDPFEVVAASDGRPSHIRAGVPTTRTFDECDPFIGFSAAIRQLRLQAESVMHYGVPILLLGESGVGKGVLAKWLHANGPRSDEAFVDIDCAALSHELIESELFGHQRGAFSGAVSAKPGLLEVAHRGTVLLDEIGALALDLQCKLLKVLEEKTFRRIGEVTRRVSDFRLIAATNSPLPNLVAKQQFRSDLYFRISTAEIHIPPLRERRQDISEIGVRLLRQCSLGLGRGEVELAQDAIEAMEHYSWPGNIRELKNVLERALLRSREMVLHATHLQLPHPFVAVEERVTLKELEERYILRTLEEENGHVMSTAKRLGIGKTSLYRKLKEYRNRANNGQRPFS